MLENVRHLTFSKSTITLLFIAAIAFLVAGWVLGIAVAMSALAGGAVALGGPQLVTFDPAPIGAALAGIGVASLLTAIGAGFGFASWLAALRNTWGLEDKAWFLGLLGLGVARFGWLALIAYVLRGPDAAKAASRASQPRFRQRPLDTPSETDHA
jgi:hypothetical protein